MNGEKNIPLIIKELQELITLLKMIENSRIEIPDMLYGLIEKKSDEIHTSLSQIRTLPLAPPTSTIDTEAAVAEVKKESPAAALELHTIQDVKTEIDLTKESGWPVIDDKISLLKESIVAEEPAQSEQIIISVAEKQGSEPVGQEPDLSFEKKSDVFDLLSVSAKKEIPKEDIQATEVESNTAEVKIGEPEVTPPATLDEVIQRRLVTDIRKAISLNDRFRFKRELFGNNEIAMSSTLDSLNAASTYADAVGMLRQYHWDEQNETVADFMAILEKRFAP